MSIRALAKARPAVWNSSGSAISTLASLASMVMNLIRLEPITAPRPPRPLERIREPGSLTEMLAAVICISPAGPMLMTADFLAEPGVQPLDDLVVAHADQFRLFGDRHAVAVTCSPYQLSACGMPSMIRALIPSLASIWAAVPPELASLMVPGQRALGPAGQTAGVGGLGAGEQTRRDHQLVAGPEGVAGRFHFGGDHGGRQSPAAESHPVRRYLLDRGAQIGHVDTKNFVGHSFIPQLVSNPLRGCLQALVVALSFTPSCAEDTVPRLRPRTTPVPEHIRHAPAPRQPRFTGLPDRLP